ncbi:MAG TPA: bifunctional glutamate N-acetyltransferase/amino-acid acetyltransferase ArgJ [Ignavibacteriaceae bacterium]|nr:bifunctional glutamate N-acetyltransferase/amino-acid acetyltransferase ArgJ [Ignavibacteriaceae bacterium]
MLQFIEKGTVTSTPGFKAAGIFCGIKKKKKDLALIYSEEPCTAAGTFTLNKVKAAPLLISRYIINEGKKIRAVLVNSGNANACTGDQGYNDALESQKLAAEKLNLKPDEILISSTGVIGKKLPMEKLKSGINKIVNHLSECGGIDAAEAILTTDTRIKSFAIKIKLGSGGITIGGICKGSGMIAPNMATMLGFITTDAIIETSLLQKLLSEAVGESFNKISVDGECSTNDMVIAMANGRSNIAILENTIDCQLFKDGLNTLCLEMAKSIVADGEGATKLVKISVKNAKSKLDADLVGKSIANSSLVKTAIYGQDANWGRILSAAGQSGADIIPEKVSIHFDKLPVLLPNYNLALDEESALKILMRPEFEINVDLGIGTEETTWWTCDLTEQYVKINSDYRT